MDSLDLWLDSTLAERQKRLVHTGKRIATAINSAARAIDHGDLASAQQALKQVQPSNEELTALAESMRRDAENYDVGQFLRERFESDLRNACADANLQLEGTFPTFVVPPVRVRVDSSAGRIRINRTIYHGLRLSRVVELIKAERDRITRRAFNAREFLRELAEAYDDLVTLETAQSQRSLSGIQRRLKDLYQRLTPRREWRNQYPETFFGYDLHRLLAAGELSLSDGRRMYLSPARVARDNLAILDPGGREVQYGLIAFRSE